VYVYVRQSWFTSCAMLNGCLNGFVCVCVAAAGSGEEGNMDDSIMVLSLLSTSLFDLCDDDRELVIDGEGPISFIK
jgi:hypothetical protein